ncbi:MAG: hypothetical protein E6G01_10070 [Actinobacteria bacterium]|nr:MAG: hypothetical protein E6G01_10070 [Actinomycetota bacterium]
MNRRAWRGDSGAVMLRTYLRGARSVTASSSLSMAMAVGGSTVDRISNRRTSAANSLGSNRSMITIAAPARRPNNVL